MTRIKILLLFAFSISLFASCNSNGQSKRTDTVKIIQDFQLGTKYQYEVQRGKIDSRKPGIENFKSSTDVEFCVLSHNKDVRECSWKYGSTKVIGINSDQIDEQSSKFMNVFQGMEVKFTIDNNAIIQEITNFEECNRYIENAFKQIYENTSKTMTPEQHTKIMGTLKATYETPEMLVSTYCPELTVFFSMFGESLKSDSVYISKSDLPNPFGGRSFPTNVTTKIERIEDNIAIISVEQTIPSKDLNSIMKETFIELSKLSEKPFNVNEIPKVNMKTYATFSYDIKKKSLNEISSEKHIETNDVKQTQTLKVIFKK